MNIPKNSFTQNKFVQNRYVKKTATFIVSNAIKAAKKIVPGVCVMSCAFYLNHSLNANRRPANMQQGNAVNAEWAYKAGEQRLRDSLTIVELKKQIAADSIKIYELTKKAGLDKSVKK